MDIEFLHEVQRKNWLIVDVMEDAVIARCRARGCMMGAKLVQGSAIPNVCRPDRGPEEITVEVFEHIRTALKRRREELGISISELEDVVGMARDQIAKSERPNPTRIPNIQTIMEWSDALGYRFAMIPKNMPAITLRYLEQTRDLADRRKADAQRRREISQD